VTTEDDPTQIRVVTNKKVGMSTNTNTPDSELAGQVAIVTDGGRGLGRSYAQALSRAGAAVAVLARSADQLAETVSIIEQRGGPSRFRQT
jgi:NADP-dependent 3-hydroxy acid dehydrogenase YdfG